MAKKTDFEKFMTQALRKKPVQRSIAGAWEDYNFGGATMVDIERDFSDGRLRVKPNAALVLEHRIYELKRKLRLENEVD